MTLMDERPQHMNALARANEVRLPAAQLKRELSAGMVSFAEAINDPRAASIKIIDLLRAQRAWGAKRARVLLAVVHVAETKRVGELTERQCRVICERMAPVRGARRSAVAALDEPFLSLLVALIDECEMAAGRGEESWVTTSVLARRLRDTNASTGVRLACLRRHGYVERRETLRDRAIWTPTETGEMAAREAGCRDEAA